MLKRRDCLILLGGSGLLATGAVRATDPRSVIDDAGRRVELPDTIERVYAAGPPASILLYTLAPEQLLGWNRAPRPEERPFLTAPYRDLPELGRLTGRGNTANVETLLAADAELVLDYGTISPTYVSLADRVQQQTGIPYLLLDGGFDRIPASYRSLGQMLDRVERAERLAAAAETIIRDASERVASVAEADRPRVYYARGPEGLTTALPGSINVESLERMGARNVAEGQGRGLAEVSLEQVLAWDPEIIVTIDPAFRRTVVDDPLWHSVSAVRGGRVHLAPRLPFGWVDFPPSVNRLIGLYWLGRVLYPEQFPEDLRTRTDEFYRLFYQVELDPEQLDTLLGTN